MPEIAVVVVNWNGAHLLRTCLGSLRRQTFADFETILVDNGSTDDSLALVARRVPRGPRRWRSPRTSGWPAAPTPASRITDAPIIATLNNDTEADPRWLAELHAALDGPPGGRLGRLEAAAVRPARRDPLGRRLLRPGRHPGQPRRLAARRRRVRPPGADLRGVRRRGGLPPRDAGRRRPVRGQLLHVLRGRRPGVPQPASRLPLRLRADGRRLPHAERDRRRAARQLLLRAQLPAGDRARHARAAAAARLAAGSCWRSFGSPPSRCWHVREPAARAKLRGQLDGLRELPRLLGERRAIQRRRRVPIRYLRSIMAAP